MNEDSDGEGKSASSNYIPEPFPEHELEPYGWQDILATLDVCANVHATKHCDEKGYDIVSFNMVEVHAAREEAKQRTTKLKSGER